MRSFALTATEIHVSNMHQALSEISVCTSQRALSQKVKWPTILCKVKLDVMLKHLDAQLC